MRWQDSWRADPVARLLADRHYNRQKKDATQFVPPGSCVVFRTPEGDAFWVTSAPIAKYVKHAWAGAWMCSAFRNESPHLSSELIREAVAATCAHYWRVSPPDIGFVTFVDPNQVRRKRDPGRCYLRAGFRLVGKTQAGLLAFQLLPREFPLPCDAISVGDERYCA